MDDHLVVAGKTDTAQIAIVAPATVLAAAWLYGVPMAVLWWYNQEWFTVAWALLPWHLGGWVVQDVVHLAQDGWRVKW